MRDIISYAKKEGTYMSILMEVLEEELDRLNRQEQSYENALSDLPKGYISKKII